MGYYLAIMIAGVIFSIAAVSFGIAMYHFYYAIRGIRGDKQLITSLIPLFTFFTSSNFDEKGNYHRVKMLNNLSIFLVCGLIILVFSSIFKY